MFTWPQGRKGEPGRVTAKSSWLRWKFSRFGSSKCDAALCPPLQLTHQWGVKFKLPHWVTHGWNGIFLCARKARPWHSSIWVWGISKRPSKSAGVAPTWGGDGFANLKGKEKRKGKGKIRGNAKGKGQRGKINWEREKQKGEEEVQGKGRSFLLPGLTARQWAAPWAGTPEQPPLPALGLLAAHFGIHSAGDKCAWLHHLAQLWQ